MAGLNYKLYLNYSLTTLSLKKKVTSHLAKNNPASNNKECFVARKKYQKIKKGI